MTDTPSRNYSLLSLVPQPSNVVSKGSYTPIGDTGIPPNRYWNEASEALEAGGGACRSQNHQNVKM